MTKVPEVPEVYCPKEKRKVPIWWCLGSHMQQRDPCPELLEATVKISEDYAKVKCREKLAVRNTMILTIIAIGIAVVVAYFLSVLCRW